MNSFYILLLNCLLSSVVGQGLRQPAEKKVKPVSVTVLTEALCPYCEQFIIQELYPTYQALGATAMDLQVLPFGNAKIDQDHKVVKCQHGPGECDANTFELCAIALTNGHVEDYLPFLLCTARQLPPGFAAGPFDHHIFQACAVASNLWWEALLACHDTPSLAWQVTQKAAADTPDHPYVPYVLLNGEPMKDDVDFMEEVCRLYQEQGVEYPPCRKQSMKTKDVFAVAKTCPNDWVAWDESMESTVVR